MEIVNTGTAAVTLSGNFYNENGTAATVPFASNASNLTINGGAFSNYSLAAGAVLVISTGTTPSTTPAVGTTTWGKFTASGAISVTSFFELHPIDSHDVSGIRISFYEILLNGIDREAR